MTHDPTGGNIIRPAFLPKGHPFRGAPIVSTYSRAQAIADGCLIDLSATARALGLRYPVACTHATWAAAIAADTSDADGSPEATERRLSRVRQLLETLRAAARISPDDIARFSMQPHGLPLGSDFVELWARCTGGDDGQPVVTIMLRGED